MSDKDWFDDYMDYKLSQSESAGKPVGCLVWILGGMIVFWIIAMLFS